MKFDGERWMDNSDDDRDSIYSQMSHEGLAILCEDIDAFKAKEEIRRLRETINQITNIVERESLSDVGKLERIYELVISTRAALEVKP